MVTVFWDCVGEILLGVMQRGTTVNSCVYQHAEKMRKHFQRVRPDKILREMLLQHDNARCHTRVKTRAAITQLGRTGGVTTFTLQPRLSVYRFSLLHTPERCCLQKEVWVRWLYEQLLQNLVASTVQVMEPFGHTCSHSTLAQSYRPARRFRMKLGYINFG
jgi:hypothetical protein